MTKPLVQVRIDTETKEQATAVLAAIGLTISDATRLMLRRVVIEKKLPFEPLVPNAKTIAAIKDARDGKTTRAKTMKGLLKALDEDD